MSTYVMSDLHGCYDEYLKMLEKINFSDDDMLYIAGDIMDRGPKPMEILLDIYNRPNVCLIRGNHEYMALECFEILHAPLEKLSEEKKEIISAWQLNGGVATSDEFHKLSRVEKGTATCLLYAIDNYREVSVGGRNYILMHAAPKNFIPEKLPEDYSFEDFLYWAAPDYDQVYFKDKFLVTGHTPTAFIEGNPRPNSIFRKNNHIAIDCGAAMGGRLGCLRLDDGAEFYIEVKDD